MFRVHAGVVDYAILAVYFAVVLGIGFAARRAVHSAARRTPLTAAFPRLLIPWSWSSPA